MTLVSLKYFFPATIVRMIDPDTALVRPSIYPQDTQLRVRLRDRWEVEKGEEGYEAAFKAAQDLFPPDSRVTVYNERIKWSHGRLEARLVPHKKGWLKEL